MKGTQDNLKRRLVGKLRVRINRDTTAVVAHRQAVIRVQFYLDPVCVARNGFVHRVIKDFRHHVVQRPFVRAADIHAGAFADGFEPLQHFDRGRVIGLLAILGEKVVGHGIPLWLMVLVWAVLFHARCKGAKGIRLNGHYIQRATQICPPDRPISVQPAGLYLLPGKASNTENGYPLTYIAKRELIILTDILA